MARGKAGEVGGSSAGGSTRGVGRQRTVKENAEPRPGALSTQSRPPSRSVSHRSTPARMEKLKVGSVIRVQSSSAMGIITPGAMSPRKPSLCSLAWAEAGMMLKRTTKIVLVSRSFTWPSP